MPATPIGPVALTGALVALEPLSPGHHDALVGAVSDGRVWEQWNTLVPSPDEMATDIERRLRAQDAGAAVPFAVRRLEDGRIVGATSVLAIDPAVPRIEIGSTWYAASAQRTGVNTEAKLLLLGQAFDGWGCVRVELKTHTLNARSRRAIERIGGQLEGVLHRHLRLRDGLVRDTALYAILDHEWPVVRAHLRALLDARA